MFAGLGFVFTRILQILTTIPIWGMLAYFIDGYVKSKTTPAAEILTLFIVSVLACAWALLTFWQFHSHGQASLVTAVVDVLFIGGFIAAVVLLRGIQNANCASGGAYLSAGVNGHGGSVSLGNGSNSISISKNCMMLKAAWVLGIINCVLFGLSAFFAWQLYRRGVGAVATTKTYDNGYTHRRRTRRHHYV